MLLSLISPDPNNPSNLHNKKLVDNYDIQQMDIVDDHPLPPPLPPFPPPPQPLPPNHLQFFDPLPPLPPPPPSLFNMFAVNQPYPSTNWPRPNFVQQTSIPSLENDVWQTSFNNPTDVDLRLHPIPVINDHISPQKPQQQRRKRSKKFPKKHHHERNNSSSVATANHIEKLPSSINDEDDEEEHLLREELLRTLSTKRKVKIIERTNPEPDRIVTIIPPNVNPTPVVVVNKPVEISTKSQYSINQRYKSVKANVSLTNVTNKTETVVRTTQPIIQTRNKIVRAVNILLIFF
jgi:hypothetical protein